MRSLWWCSPRQPRRLPRLCFGAAASMTMGNETWGRPPRHAGVKILSVLRSVCATTTVIKQQVIGHELRRGERADDTTDIHFWLGISRFCVSFCLCVRMRVLRHLVRLCSTEAVCLWLLGIWLGARCSRGDGR